MKCFAKYLIWIRNELKQRFAGRKDYTPETEIDLLMDLYLSHRNDISLHIAKLLNFDVHFVPAGFTD